MRQSLDRILARSYTIAMGEEARARSAAELRPGTQFHLDVHKGMAEVFVGSVAPFEEEHLTETA